MNLDLKTVGTVGGEVVLAAAIAHLYSKVKTSDENIAQLQKEISILSSYILEELKKRDEETSKIKSDISNIVNVINIIQRKINEIQVDIKATTTYNTRNIINPHPDTYPVSSQYNHSTYSSPSSYTHSEQLNYPIPSQHNHSNHHGHNPHTNHTNAYHTTEYKQPSPSYTNIEPVNKPVKDSRKEEAIRKAAEMYKKREAELDMYGK